MTLIYADTSAIVSAYFPDELDHEALRALLLEGHQPVVSSELALLEFSSAVHAAARGGRVANAGDLVARMAADCGADGPLMLLRLRPDPVLGRAQTLLAEHALRTLDAIHLAVALEDAAGLIPGEPLVFASRDRSQAAAAADLGLALA